MTLDVENEYFFAEGKWKVWVTTSDQPSAGTDAQVTLTVYGSRGNSGPIPLGYADGETFQSGNIDEFEVNSLLSLLCTWLYKLFTDLLNVCTFIFQVSVGNIGEIFKVRVAHDNSGSNSQWMLDEVKKWRQTSFEDFS